ncbi:MAG: PHP domain-containing protein [Deltaproteobacteria bacterium]|jgi:predicted metal-dependent phosphoesterase TrpH|nr:PHP domain-containing protein [Deltaproteobacteria bacterium]
MRKIDLHSHSTFSDGTLTPKQLVLTARAVGLEALALTDHDTLEGVDEFLEAGAKYSFQVFRGVELSLNYKGITHLLGLELDLKPQNSLDLGFIQKFRLTRNEKVFSALINLGLDISWERILEIGGDGQVGKPHFARVIVEKGYAKDLQDAFERYLGRGKPAYVDKERLTPPEAISLLLEAGYTPVLAHPISLRIPREDYFKDLTQWKEWGLVGLEVFHPDHSLEVSEFFLDLALKVGLVATNGSDYHGANKKTPITWVRENSPLTYEIIPKLKSGFLETYQRIKKEDWDKEKEG